ncbi:MAG: hypothetical protein M1825_002595 [Sarcosagium campestre]|nr:MAG: hypothetical protein M1825_002595 [Sarcosagium campestre]
MAYDQTAQYQPPTREYYGRLSPSHPNPQQYGQGAGRYQSDHKGYGGFQDPQDQDRSYGADYGGNPYAQNQEHGYDGGRNLNGHTERDRHAEEYVQYGTHSQRDPYPSGDGYGAQNLGMHADGHGQSRPEDVRKATRPAGAMRSNTGPAPGTYPGSQISPLSPHNQSWDNPFPTFPGSAKKDSSAEFARLNRGVADMNIAKSSGGRPQMTSSSGSQRSNRSQEHYAGNQAYDNPEDSHSSHRNQPGPKYGQPYDAQPPAREDRYGGQRPYEPVRSHSDRGMVEPSTAPVTPLHDRFELPAQRSNTMPSHITNDYNNGPVQQSQYQGGSLRARDPMASGTASRNYPVDQPYQDDRGTGNYVELPAGDAFDSNGRHPPLEKDMPNFDAAGPKSSHRRGASIDNHLPTDGGYLSSARPPQQFDGGDSGDAEQRRARFAAQSQNSRSQPDLRAQSAAGRRTPGPPGPRGQPGPPRGGYDHPGDMPTMGRGAGWGPRGGARGGPPPNHYPRGPNPNLGPRRPNDRPPPQRMGTSGYGPPGMGPGAPGPHGHPGQGSNFDAGRPRPSGPHRGQTPGPDPARTPSGGRPPNPDALPSHPVPVRPGLMSNAGAVPGNAPPSKPPPVRNYGDNTGSQARLSDGSQGRRESIPVTHDEILRLEGAVNANPSDQRTQLSLAKKLVEAAAVLADEGGRADLKTRNRNREKYIMDSHKIIKRLVAAGYPDAMFYLGDCHSIGRLGLEADPKEAFNMYQSAAKAGHAQAAYRTAVCCEMGQDDGGGTRKDPMKAIQWYKRAAALGDTPAMYKMGIILLKGLLGQQRNPREAVVWLKRAAERADEENPHALHQLARSTYGATLDSNANSSSGNDSIIRDEDYSKQLFIQAADLGYKFSQFRLGCAYEYGLMKSPIDPRQSIMWYSRAAVQGEHQSELALSGWYLTGAEGVLQQNDTEAFLWARKAAQSGLSKAQYALGYFTEVGIGCPSNLEEAKRWYWRSAAQNFPKARERLDELRKGGAKMQKTRERISRSKFSKQNEGDCVVM